MASLLPVSLTLLLLLSAKLLGCQAGDCKGHRQVLRGPPGYVTDGPGNYSVNGNCEWLIKGVKKSSCLLRQIDENPYSSLCCFLCFQLPATVTALS